MQNVFVWTIGDVIGIVTVSAFVFAVIVAVVADRIKRWRKKK